MSTERHNVAMSRAWKARVSSLNYTQTQNTRLLSVGLDCLVRYLSAISFANKYGNEKPYNTHA